MAPESRYGFYVWPLGREHARATASDKNIAMRVGFFIAVRVIMIISNLAKTGSVPNDVFVAHPH